MRTNLITSLLCFAILLVLKFFYDPITQVLSKLPYLGIDGAETIVVLAGVIIFILGISSLVLYKIKYIPQRLKSLAADLKGKDIKRKAIVIAILMVGSILILYRESFPKNLIILAIVFGLLAFYWFNDK